MADYDPHLEKAAQALAKAVSAFSRRVRTKLLQGDSQSGRHTPSAAKIIEYINRQLCLDGGQISKLQRPAAKSPGPEKLREYLVLATVTILEEKPHEHYICSEELKQFWKQSLVDCGAAEFRAKAIEMFELADSAEPLSMTLDDPAKPVETTDNSIGEPEGPIPRQITSPPKPKLNLADSVVMDCRALPTNNPDDGVMIAIEIDFLDESILKSTEGYSLSLDNVQLLLDMNGVEHIECDSPLSRPAAKGDDALRLKAISMLKRRVTWHLDNGKKSCPLRGTYQEFIFARVFGQIVPDDCVTMFARQASFRLSVDNTVWPFKDGTTEFQVLETFLKKHDLGPTPGHAGSYVLASQNLMRSDV